MSKSTISFKVVSESALLKIPNVSVTDYGLTPADLTSSGTPWAW